jgi:hypothetical protein
MNVPIIAKSPEEAAPHFWLFRVIHWNRLPGLKRANTERLGWCASQPWLIPDQCARGFET